MRTISDQLFLALQKITDLKVALKALPQQKTLALFKFQEKLDERIARLKAEKEALNVKFVQGQHSCGQANRESLQAKNVSLQPNRSPKLL